MFQRKLYHVFWIDFIFERSESWVHMNWLTFNVVVFYADPIMLIGWTSIRTRDELSETEMRRDVAVRNVCLSPKVTLWDLNLNSLLVVG